MLTAASTRITYGILTRLTFANGSVIGNEETGKKTAAVSSIKLFLLYKSTHFPSVIFRIWTAGKPGAR